MTTEYAPSFYQLYGDYLTEPGVREAHDWVLKIAHLDAAFQHVLDLGCGQHNEFWIYGRTRSYRGVDLNPTPGGYSSVARRDYRTDDLADVAPEATAFVSLFSSEITAPAAQNYALYHRLFSERPKLQAGLVSGFYYTDRVGQPIVEEAGGIRSYQTLAPIDETLSLPLFTERRIVLPVPSQMFGPNVIEVWKFFRRRSA